MIDPAFDGHPVLEFARMDAEMRLDDLSRKIALVLELRASRVESVAKLEPTREALGAPTGLSVQRVPSLAQKS
jgi:hypothetical protein